MAFEFNQRNFQTKVFCNGLALNVIDKFCDFFSSRAFDVELLYIAQCLGIPVAEVPVNWQEIDGKCLSNASSRGEFHCKDLVHFRKKILKNLKIQQNLERS